MYYHGVNPLSKIVSELIKEHGKSNTGNYSVVIDPFPHDTLIYSNTPRTHVDSTGRLGIGVSPNATVADTIRFQW